MTVPNPGSPVRQEGGGESPPRPPPRGHAPHDRGQSLKSAEQVTVILQNLPGRARKSRAGLGLGPLPAELTPCSLTAPRRRRVLCVGSRPERPSHTLGGRRAASPRGAPGASAAPAAGGAPHPRSGPCICDGAHAWCPVHAGPAGKGAEIPCSGSPALPRSALARSPARVVGPQVLES